MACKGSVVRITLPFHPCLSKLWTQTAVGLHLGSDQRQGHLSVSNGGLNFVGACSPVKRAPENASSLAIALG